MTKQLSWDKRVLKWLNTDMQSKHVATIIALMGLVVFFSGLNGQFQGDDQYQVVDNVAVHSLQNIGHFFTESTFWNGEALVGSFYRPLMTTTFSFVYSFFGASPVAFHIVQLLLYMGCAFVLYLFMKTFFKPAVALGIALVFLVHPINSQAVFAIPSMQEPLFMLFGLLGLWQLSRSQSTKSFFIAAMYLLLSLLSKETGIVFIFISLLYVFLFYRRQFVLLLKITALPVIIYVLLRIHAVGLFHDPIRAAPISHASPWERLLTLPSIILFYIATFVFPLTLATSYYWLETKMNFQTVLLPLLIDILVIGGMVYAGFVVHRGSKKVFQQFVFFTVWAIVGILPYTQIIPLDMTACETWFFCALPGILGMLAITLSILLRRVRIDWIMIGFVLLLGVLSVRTAVRGIDYKNQFTLASKDVAVSSGNYLAMNNLAQSLINDNKFQDAKRYAEQSIAIYPAVTNYTNLGAVKQRLGDNAGAEIAYEKALSYGSLAVTYENLGLLHFIANRGAADITYIQTALKSYPKNSKLWMYLAILQAENGSTKDAKTSITNAAAYGQVPAFIYKAIMYDTALTIPVPGTNRVIHIQQK